MRGAQIRQTVSCPSGPRRACNGFGQVSWSFLRKEQLQCSTRLSMYSLGKFLALELGPEASVGIPEVSLLSGVHEAPHLSLSLGGAPDKLIRH
jgi:hypothetical protein